MKINFRQGLVLSEIGSNGQPNYLTYDSSVGVSLRATNRATTFTVASGTKNYTIEFYRDVLAWPNALLVGVQQAWLYIDINATTSTRNYGITTVAPVHGPTAPSNPVNDQHWFDLTQFRMKVFNSTTQSWITVIRVFAGEYYNTTVTSSSFGTQIGVTGSAVTGLIFIDGFGVAVKDSQGEFITTEDTLTVSGAPSYAAKLESNVTIAEAGEPISAFSAVRYNDQGRVVLANYVNTGTSAIGITTGDADIYEAVNLVLHGQIQNPDWNWSGPNITLWIGLNGQLVTSDPHLSNGSIARQPPVARTLNATTILFNPGLVNNIGDRGPTGLKGDKGDQGEPGADGDTGLIDDASDLTRGVLKVSVAPAVPTNPIAVGINDPILTAPRPPTAHQHPATEVNVAGFGDFQTGNAQAALEYLQTVHRITYKKFVLPPAASIATAFNGLSTNDRTLIPNEIAVIEWANTVYLWTGGAGYPAVATNDSQFMIIGKMTTPLSIKVAKAFTAYTVGA